MEVEAQADNRRHIDEDDVQDQTATTNILYVYDPTRDEFKEQDAGDASSVKDHSQSLAFSDVDAVRLYADSV